MSDETNVVVAVDEDGNEIELEVVAELEVDGKMYAVLVPSCEEGCECGEGDDDEDGEECIVCRVEGEGDDQNLVEIEDEDEYEKVMEALDELYADEILEEEEEGGTEEK